jgi:hypothetical protein
MDQRFPRLLTVGLLATVVAADAAAQTWRPYRNDEQRFTVELPGDPAAMTARRTTTPQGLAVWTLIGEPPVLPAEVAIEAITLSTPRSRLKDPYGMFRQLLNQRSAKLHESGLSAGEEHWRTVCGEPALVSIIYPIGARHQPLLWSLQVSALGSVFTLDVRPGDTGTALKDRVINSFRPLACEGYTFYRTGEDYWHRLTSDKLGFSLVMPGKPSLSNGDLPGDLVMVLDRGGVGSSNGYTLTYSKRRPADPADPQAWLDARLKAFNDDMFVTEVEARSRVCGAPAVRYVRRGRKGSGGVRLFAVAFGDTLVEMQSGEKWQPTLHEDERRFFGSFELLPCPR